SVRALMATEAMAVRQLESIVEEIDRDLRAARQIMRRPLEAEIARGGLTGPQTSAMRSLVLHDGMSLKDLSKQLGLAHSTVSGIVDRLEKQGFVERRADDSDRRVSKIHLTGRVRDYMRDQWPCLERHPLAEALRAATPAERKAVQEGVRTLR